MGYWRVLKVEVYCRLKLVVNGVALQVFTMLIYSFATFICVRMRLWTFQFKNIREPRRCTPLPARPISDCGCALETCAA